MVPPGAGAPSGGRGKQRASRASRNDQRYPFCLLLASCTSTSKHKQQSSWLCVMRYARYVRGARSRRAASAGKQKKASPRLFQGSSYTSHLTSRFATPRFVRGIVRSQAALGAATNHTPHTAHSIHIVTVVDLLTRTPLFLIRRTDCGGRWAGGCVVTTSLLWGRSLVCGGVQHYYITSV